MKKLLIKRESSGGQIHARVTQLSGDLMPDSAAWIDELGAKSAAQRDAPRRRPTSPADQIGPAEHDAEHDALGSAAGILAGVAISIPIWAGLIGLAFWLLH